MWIHTVRQMQLETVLAKLPADCKQSDIPPVGKGKEGEERGASTTTFRKADTAGTWRAGRPEPTIKAQGMFGTNELADVAAR